MELPESPQELQDALWEVGYLADPSLIMSVWLSLSMGRPLLLEGEAGTGKTDLAKALAGALDLELIRLQCYGGIDQHQALYEWDYTRQILYMRALSTKQIETEEAIDSLFGDRFLLERPLLRAMRAGGKCLLLIDEIDRADDEFEAFLLEVLSDFQVTIPELGTVKADEPPVVILTSNRTRDVHDALKRRCLYHWIDTPTMSHEIQIAEVCAPDMPDRLTSKLGKAKSGPARRAAEEAEEEDELSMGAG
ncbi:MAG: AAA family ATPase [Actinomycetota bacterium]